MNRALLKALAKVLQFPKKQRILEKEAEEYAFKLDENT